MAEPNQQQFLHDIKDELGVTWDALAQLAGVAPRALKTYRMPETSADHRVMGRFVRAAFLQALTDHRNSKTK